METALIIAAIVAFCALIGWMLSKIDIGFIPACPETADPPRYLRPEEKRWEDFYNRVSKKNGTKIDGQVFWLFKNRKFLFNGNEYGVSEYELTDNHFIVIGNSINLTTGKTYTATVDGELP